ncbi:50S ribosomal protein L14 [Candidatus Vidania fulgoroideorum]
MIQTRTILDVLDNSGAKKVMCIKVLGGSKKYIAHIGDRVKVSIRKSNSKVKMGSIMNAIVVNTRYGIKRKDGVYVRFDRNAVVLVDNMWEDIVGSRIVGIIPKEVVNLKGMYKFIKKIISLSRNII